MSKKAEKPAIDLAGLTKKYNAAAKVVAELAEDASEEVREKAIASVNEALEALNEGKQSVFVTVKFLLTPTGRFNLAYTKGDVGEVNVLLAEAMEEEGYCAIKSGATADDTEVIDEEIV
jgi:ElaB/YqjD/DUF883 family membrane-anchored ribosome-binding protein